MKSHSSDKPGDLMDRFLEGDLSDEEFNELKNLLRTDSELRDRYFGIVKMDTLLRQVAGESDSETPVLRRTSRMRSRLLIGAGLVSTCLLLAVFLAGIGFSNRAAEIGAASDDVAWSTDQREKGETLRAGELVSLEKGSIEIHFSTGAMTRIHGPASFEITSNNGGFLHYGQAWSRADTESSQGFTIQTRSGRFVDQGTEFLTTARKDGFSQMQVSSGAVDVEIEGFERQRIKTGSGVGIEPGTDTVLIQIESGTETPDFLFPTIPPPSNSDTADLSQGQAQVFLSSRDERKGRDNLPHPRSGPPQLLLDGRSQSGKDQPEESFYFPDGAEGSILLDLGRSVPVARVHTYSWHLNDEYPSMRRRAVQRYTLWGAVGEKPESEPKGDDSNGWIRIARVDTDLFFQVEDDPERPAQQACAISTSAPQIGEFRYLLFQVIPTPMPEDKRDRHTFFGEIDVITVPNTP